MGCIFYRQVFAMQTPRGDDDPSVDRAIVRHWFKPNGEGRCWKVLPTSLSGVAKIPLSWTRKRFGRCVQKLRGEPANAMRSRERAKAVANDFLSRKLKPWIGK
jgi:hypothetical protein